MADEAKCPVTGAGVEEAAKPSSARLPNDQRKTLVLTGASRGIGHATVKRFSSAGWRVLTCSRHPFPEDCPWEMGEEDHIQVDLADPENTERAIAIIRERLRNRAGGSTRW